MRSVSRALIAAVAMSCIVLLPAAPAHATVHEIVAQWCSGKAPLAPPGLTGGSQAGNFAQPLNASGFIQGVVPFRDGFLIKFNYDNPNAKVVGTGVFVVVGEIDGQPLYLELIQPDPSFPAFQRCPRLATG